MMMNIGEQWRSTNPACRSVALVEANGGIDGKNPRSTTRSLFLFAAASLEPSAAWSASSRALIFLLWGSDLLRDALLYPLEAQAVSILAAAFGITLSAIVFYFLPKPRHGLRARA